MIRSTDELRGVLRGSPLRTLPFEVWHGPLDLDAALAGTHPPRSVSGLILRESEIPFSTVYVVERGDSGIVVRAVQQALNVVMKSGLVLDGSAGRKTELAIEDFQEEEGLTPVDGKFGPISSEKMAGELEAMTTSSVPAGLLHGQMAGESGLLIGAVNWGVPGGVDCGYTQRRVYEADFGDSTVERRAFAARYQTALSARTLRTGHDGYLGDPGCPTNELAWRCSAQRHNYPSGADAVAKHGIGNLPSYYVTPQSWVGTIGVQFADGNAVETPWEWMEFYAFGAPGHGSEGLVTKYVSDWTP